jgi:membrane-bound ClpP family serine protease
MQIVLGVVVPAVFGLICGILVGISEPAYLVVSILAIAGGYFAGLEHRTVGEGALRGLNGGLLFGVFILFGHEFSGEEAKAELPEPEILLVVITTVLGAGLGALGGRSRARRARREPAPAPAAADS